MRINAVLKYQIGNDMFLFDSRDECGESMAKSNKSVALNALKELHRIFATSDVTRKELLETSRRVRNELIAELYPNQTS
jgi:hypothetical protein